MTAEDRRHVLERVIEERLLLERALQIGLPYSDPRVRKTIINAMIETTVSDTASVEPGDSELADFYSENQNYFTQPARIQVRRLVFRGDGAEKRASAARELLLETNDWLAATELADTDILALPSSPLPLGKLRGYLGPTLSEAAQALQAGEFSEVLPDQSGFTLLQLLSLQHNPAPPLADIRDQVAREYQRRAGDEALRDYLDMLRKEATVIIDEDFLAELDRLEAASD